MCACIASLSIRSSNGFSGGYRRSMAASIIGELNCGLAR